MKKTVKGILGLLTGGVLALGLVGGANAAVVYTVDTLLGHETIGSSGDATELARMSFYSEVPVADLVLDYKGLGLTPALDGAGNWFLNVSPTEPGFFMLKFGVGSKDTWDSHYFFENIGELTKLVWTTTQIQGAMTPGSIGKLSHYSYYKGPSEVPEPATLVLLGLGALGLGFSRRRKQA